ncbi:MAG: MFS transporter [Clostridia bacterium]|nr:MFS transporter [Clostridia bacterium]
MYTLLLALIYLAFISLGLPDSLLGTAWPVMRIEFGLPMSYAGIISMIISGGTIVSSLMSERLTKKLGTPAVTVASVFLTAVSLFGFSVSKSFLPLCFLAVPYGLGAGAIDAALNNYVAVHYNSRHMSWLHCFWGVGTIISPYVMSLALTYSSWNTGYLTVSVIQVTIALILLCTLGVWRVNAKKDGLDSEGSSRIIGISGALRIKGVPTLLFGFFAYCAAEAIAMLWSASYLVEARGLSEEIAASLTSLFFIGMTLGRFINGFLTAKLQDGAIIRIGTAVSAVGALLVIIPIDSPITAIVGLGLIGLGFAPIYPSIIHSTPANFGKENSEAIIGIQMASAYLGTTLMPPLFGVIADLSTIKLFPIFILGFTALMIVMVEITAKKTSSD